MTADESSRSSLKIEPQAVLLLIAFATVLVHLATNAFGGYGYFRDELYYLACSHHLSWGYVDQPPLSIALLAVSRLLFGETLIGLRFLPALAAGATVYLAGIMARELGGGRFGQALAAFAVLCSPIYLGMMSFYSMNSFDILVWAVCAYVIIRLIKTDKPRVWILLGIVLGLGLLNKIGILWLGFGIFAGLLLTGERRWLKTRWPWLSGGIAFLLFLPYVIWNITHDFAHLEFIRNATAGKYSGLTPLRFLTDQFLLNNPVSLPIWGAGLWFFFTNKKKRFALLGWVYIGALVVLLANFHSKAEYLCPAYTMLFAGGAVWIEEFLARRSLKRLRPIAIGLVLVSGIMFMPFALAVLPVETYIRYSKVLGMAPSTPENNRLAQLPQFYADMFGWEKLAETVSSIYEDLPPEDKAHCIVYTQNYGEAGAIDFFRTRLDLPRVVSGHNSYFLWGPGRVSRDSAVVIIVGGRMEDHLQSFERVDLAGMTNCDYCMPYENHRPIYVCRGLKKDIEDLWPLTKNYS